jgi:hypothetical protein
MPCLLTPTPYGLIGQYQYEGSEIPLFFRVPIHSSTSLRILLAIIMQYTVLILHIDILTIHDTTVRRKLSPERFLEYYIITVFFNDH